MDFLEKLLSLKDRKFNVSYVLSVVGKMFFAKNMLILTLLLGIIFFLNELLLLGLATIASVWVVLFLWLFFAQKEENVKLFLWQFENEENVFYRKLLNRHFEGMLSGERTPERFRVVFFQKLYAYYLTRDMIGEYMVLDLKEKFYQKNLNEDEVWNLLLILLSEKRKFPELEFDILKFLRTSELYTVLSHFLLQKGSRICEYFEKEYILYENGFEILRNDEFMSIPKGDKYEIMEIQCPLNLIKDYERV